MVARTKDARPGPGSTVDTDQVRPTDSDTQVGPVLTTEDVWRALGKSTFAVISHVTPTGEPRSSGVLCQAVGRRLYVAVAPDSWKAKHIALDGHVAMVVTVRRGGLLSLVFPIPPATIGFHGTAVVHKADDEELGSVLKNLERLLPVERRSACKILEIIPEGEFLTYGVGVSLSSMRTPAISRGRAPVA